MIGRYDAVGDEAEFEPGSRRRVLRNRIGITSLRAMERKESEALLIATGQAIDETSIDQRFTAGDIQRMHRLWRGGEEDDLDPAAGGCVPERVVQAVPGGREQVPLTGFGRCNGRLLSTHCCRSRVTPSGVVNC